jgi:hypothetical protein
MSIAKLKKLRRKICSVTIDVRPKREKIWKK